MSSHEIMNHISFVHFFLIHVLIHIIPTRPDELSVNHLCNVPVIRCCNPYTQQLGRYTCHDFGSILCLPASFPIVEQKPIVRECGPQDLLMKRNDLSDIQIQQPSNTIRQESWNDLHVNKFCWDKPSSHP